jgi:hypothetical protein
MAKAIVKKISATNMVEKQPRGKKVSAKGAAGAYGAGLALVFIKEAEESAQAELRAEVSYKDRLRELEKCAREDHLEFRKGLDERRDLIGKEAAKVKLGVAKYLEANTVDRTIYNRLSMWDRMSRACEAGYRPNYDKSWAEISLGASDKLKAQAAAEAQAKINERIKAIESDESKPAEVKQAEITILRHQMPVESASPTARKSARGRKRQEKPLWDSVLELIKDRPIHDVEKLTQQLLFFIAEKMGNKGVRSIADSLVEDMTKRQVPATPSGRALKPGVSGERVTAEKTERATARAK